MHKIAKEGKHMNFIKVHNADYGGNPVLVNLDQVTEITPNEADESRATIYFNTDVDGLRLNASESFDQLSGMLLPYKAVNLDESKPDDVPLIEVKPVGNDGNSIRDFLTLIRDESSKRCKAPGCKNCPLDGVKAPCSAFPTMTDADIELLVKVYQKKFRMVKDETD